MDRGRIQLGEHLHLTVRTTDADGRPVAPDACPLLSVYDPTGAKLVSKLIPIADPAAVTGYFGYRLHLGAGFTIGKYRVLYTWAASGHHGAELDSFEATGGGDNQGCVIALKEFVRPHARFVVHQLDSGRLKRGRNPRL